MWEGAVDLGEVEGWGAVGGWGGGNKTGEREVVTNICCTVVFLVCSPRLSILCSNWPSKAKGRGTTRRHFVVRVTCYFRPCFADCSDLISVLEKRVVFGCCFGDFLILLEDVSPQYFLNFLREIKHNLIILNTN